MWTYTRYKICLLEMVLFHWTIKRVLLDIIKFWFPCNTIKHFLIIFFFTVIIILWLWLLLSRIGIINFGLLERARNLVKSSKQVTFWTTSIDIGSKYVTKLGIWCLWKKGTKLLKEGREERKKGEKYAKKLANAIIIIINILIVQSLSFNEWITR